MDLATFEAKAGQVADTQKAIGNARRLMLLCKLVEHGEVTVGDLPAMSACRSRPARSTWPDARRRPRHLPAGEPDAWYSIADARVETLLATLTSSIARIDAMTLVTLSPTPKPAPQVDAGARLIDIRGADEHAREHIPDAINVPLDRIANCRVTEARSSPTASRECEPPPMSRSLVRRQAAGPPTSSGAVSMRGGRRGIRPSPIDRNRWKSCAGADHGRFAGVNRRSVGLSSPPASSACRHSGCRADVRRCHGMVRHGETCCASCPGTGARLREAIMDTATILATLLSGSVIGLILGLVGGGGRSLPYRYWSMW